MTEDQPLHLRRERNGDHQMPSWWRTRSWGTKHDCSCSLENISSHETVCCDAYRHPRLYGRQRSMKAPWIIPAVILDLCTRTDYRPYLGLVLNINLACRYPLKWLTATGIQTPLLLSQTNRFSEALEGTTVAAGGLLILPLAAHLCPLSSLPSTSNRLPHRWISR